MGQTKPGPKSWLGDGFGLAQKCQSREPAAQAVARQYQIYPSNQRCALQHLRSLLLSAQKVGFYIISLPTLFVQASFALIKMHHLHFVTNDHGRLLYRWYPHILFSWARRLTMITTVNNSTTNNKKKSAHETLTCLGAIGMFFYLFLVIY